MDIGIITYGAYVPRLRITSKEIAMVWGENPEAVSKGLNVQCKSVPGPDEDVVTISVEAARAALQRSGTPPQELGAIYVGSESHPYAVKPTSTIVAEALQAAPNLTAADFEFACKAGTAAIQTCMGLVSSGMIKLGLAIGADTSQGAPGNALEYAASAGGAAFVIGKGEGVIAKLNETLSFTTDTPDFWRREGQKYPSHGERFTGKPAYFKHTISCANNLLSKCGTEPKDYNFAVFHQPNGKFPMRVAKMLGFNNDQIETGLLTPRIGNTYSGSTMLGLAAILDVASPGDRIFVVSYGSGAGSDGFDITVTDEIVNLDRDDSYGVEAMISNTRFINYATYVKYREKLKLEGE